MRLIQIEQMALMPVAMSYHQHGVEKEGDFRNYLESRMILKAGSYIVSISLYSSHLLVRYYP